MRIRFGKNGPGISIIWLRTYTFTNVNGKVKQTCRRGKLSFKWLEAR